MEIIFSIGLGIFMLGCVCFLLVLFYGFDDDKLIETAESFCLFLLFSAFIVALIGISSKESNNIVESERNGVCLISEVDVNGNIIRDTLAEREC